MKRPDEHLENIINAIGDGVFVKDRKHRWVLMNDANLKAIGYERDDLIGKSDYDFFPGEEAKVFWEKDEEVFRTGKENLNEEIITDAKGKKHIILTKKTLYRDSEGNQFIVGVSRDITERKKMEDKLKRTLRKVKNLSLTDDLTRLNNRRGFITLARQQLKLANRRKTGLVLLFADLDGMKAINDRFGHPEGDQALKDVAGILAAGFRESDIIARIGGDEFVVLAIEALRQGSELVKHLRKKLKDHNKKSTKGYKISLSIGKACYNPKSPCSIEKLMEKADRSMYRKKRKKPGIFT